jgi:FkbM family methyltransferase
MDPNQEASHAGAFLWGQYLPATTAFFFQAVTDGDTVVDVGAHWGYFTLLAASLCGTHGRVFAFEPHPRNFAFLAKNVQANDLTNVVAVQKAVSDRAGYAKLFLARTTVGHSLCALPPQWRAEGDPATAAIVVDTVALDEFFAQSSVQPRLIKLNIEGAERLALAGMRRLIERSPMLALITEFNPAYLNAKAASDFLEQLAAWGFDLAALDDDRRQLEVAPVARILKRFLDESTIINILATRDRPLIDSLLRGRESSGSRFLDGRS